MKKKYNYLLIFIIMMFSFLKDANAIEFFKNVEILPPEGRMFHRLDTLEFSKTSSDTYNLWSLYKLYTKTGKAPYYNAFCSDIDLEFYSSNSYTLDTTYTNAKCKYKVKEGNKWVEKLGGDCSQLVGYAIESAYKKAATLKKCTTSSNELKYCEYGYGQAITWTYLGLFSYGDSDYLSKNNRPSTILNVYNNNQIIRSIIEDAWINYANDLQNGKINNNEITDENLYTISGTGATNNKFYYIPTSDQCGASGGEYRTNEIIITNNKQKTIKVTVTNQTDGVTINFPDIGKLTTDSHTIELGPREKIRFYLTATKYIGESGTSATAHVKINGELVEKTTKTEIYTTPNTERWKYNGPIDPGYPGQAMVILTTDKSNHTINETNTYTKKSDLNFVQNKLEFSKPKGSNNAAGTGKCANIATNIEETSKTLEGANCKTVNLGGGSFVRIIIGETVRFNYGYLYPSKYQEYDKEPVLYAGGGFNFNTNESYAITKYEVAIKWQFADKDLATGKPYFYNATNPGNSNPETNSTSYNGTTMTIKEMINKILLEGEGSDEGILKKYQNLILEVNTYDSNNINEDGTGIDTSYSFNIYETAQNKTGLNATFDANNQIKFEISKIELKRYKMTEMKNGTIEYCEDTDEICANNGYEHRAYFVPMHYSSETFKFNINEINISLLNEIELYYTGICEIKTENRFNGPSNGESLRYRSITVKNPFPKANSNTGEGIPSNWKDWYMIAANKKRVNDTFTKGAIYILNITDSKMQAIDTYNNNSYYTDWDNIEVSGTSKFVTDIFAGEHKAGSESYCELGVFKESCDK